MPGLRYYVPLVAFAVSALHAQTVDTLPASLQDIAGQWALPAEFSFEQQIQSGTQGSSSSANPFAYWHGIQIRPWLHYDGIRNTTFTGGVSYIDYFYVPGTAGSKVTLYYGPAFSIDYNFRRDRPLNETHQRTTAFKDF